MFDSDAMITSVLSAVFSLALPWLVPAGYKYIQQQKLLSLNRYLMCDSKIQITGKLKVPLYPFLFFAVKMAALVSTILGIGWGIKMVIDKSCYPLLILGIAVFFCWIIYFLLCGLCKREVEGLVGVISTDINSVTDSEPDSNDEIYFATHYNSDMGVYSYEQRLPLTDDADIIVEYNKIVSYYNALKSDIMGKAHNKALFKVKVPGKGEMDVCDFMVQCAYSFDNIKKSINHVRSNMEYDNSINFIGDKVGVKGFTLNNGVLSLVTYRTDHFTFKVFKDIFKEGGYREVFQLLIRRFNRADMQDKILLCECLKYLFSSFGLDIIIHGRKANGKKGVLLAIRSGKIEQGAQSKIHVPVNESFSMTDLNDNNKFSLINCALRGIEEELGIPKNKMENKVKIRFTDFAIVSDEGEIGLGCDADITDVMPLEAATMFPGQDKFLEIKELFVFDFPPFIWDPRKYPNYFYRKYESSALSTPWHSFTPLLYQRLTVREATLHQIWVDIFSLVILIGLFVGIHLVFKIREIDYISEVMPGLVSLLILLCKLVRDYCKFRPKCVRPLVPQWNGDARCLQSINTSLIDYNPNDKSKKDPVVGYMMFGFENGIPAGDSPKLSDLRFTDNPWCAVRHEVTNNHAESPINFYLVRYDPTALNDRVMYIREVMAYCIGNQLQVSIRCTVKNGQRRYSFVNAVESPGIELRTPVPKLKENEALSYSLLFGVKQEYLEKLLIGNFNEWFSKKYKLLDLFSYGDKFYWSVAERQPKKQLSSNMVEITAKSDIFRDVIVLDNEFEGESVFTIVGDPQIVVEKLSKFIAHPENCKRIEQVDIYMLQLAVARLGTDNECLLIALYK